MASVRRWYVEHCFSPRSARGLLGGELVFGMDLICASLNVLYPEHLSLKATHGEFADLWPMAKSPAELQEPAVRQGAVMVTVVSARDIAAADPGGTSDPYVTVKLNEKKHKTATKKNMKGEAEWGEKFEWLKARPCKHLHARSTSG